MKKKIKSIWVSYLKQFSGDFDYSVNYYCSENQTMSFSINEQGILLIYETGVIKHACRNWREFKVDYEE